MSCDSRQALRCGGCGSVVSASAGVEHSQKPHLRSKQLESCAGAGDSPVDDKVRLCSAFPK